MKEVVRVATVLFAFFVSSCAGLSGISHSPDAGRGATEAAGRSRPYVTGPLHVGTTDYGDGYLYTAYPTQLMPYLSYTQIQGPSNAGTYHNNLVKVILYTDAGTATDNARLGTALYNYYQALQPTTTANFAHDCGIQGFNSLHPAGYPTHHFVDFNGPAFPTAFNAYVTSDPIDFWFIDSQLEDPTTSYDDVSGTQLPPCHCTVSDTMQYLVDSVIKPGLARIAHPLIMNGFGCLYICHGSYPVQVDALPSVAGGRSEGTYISPAVPNFYMPNVSQPYWSGQENTEIYFAQHNKIEIIGCLGNNSGDPTSSQVNSYRKFCYASF